MILASPLLLAAALAAVVVVVVLLFRRSAVAGDPLPAAHHAFVAGGRVGIGRALPGRPWRFAIALLLLAFVVGRPQWGAGPDAGAPRHRVVIALDLSNSMLATDMPPSRMARARAIAERLVAQSPRAEIGLIGFAGRAYLLAPPSADRAMLRRFLPAVHPDQMLVPGSDLAAVLTVAIDSFGSEPMPRTLVLLSDGEAELTAWRAVLPRLAARGIRVVSVGIGTPAGALVRSDGAPVRSRLDAATLRVIAAATGGAYVDAADADTLAARVDALGRVAASAVPGPVGAARIDRFAWFLWPALLLLAWSALVEWPALPRLSGRRRALPALGLAGAALALLVTGTAGEAVKPPPEPDPLRGVKRVVAEMVAIDRPSAAGYMALATATAAYGEGHRQHTHPLQRGVLQDGLAAVAAGAAIDPKRPGWAPLRTRLQRLLRPPRTADDPEEGDGAPEGAGTPADAADEAGYDPDASPLDARQVGGTRRSADEAAEWAVPSLVRPAFILEGLRAGDKPAALFRALQAQDPAPPRPGPGGPTW